MTDRVDIQGGAGEFEAAVIAVVLDHLAREEARNQEPDPDRSLPAWVACAGVPRLAALLHTHQPLWVRSRSSAPPIR
ncbi:MAG: hypothetical protein ACE5F5_01975 [Acidimicrobiia bacterium]